MDTSVPSARKSPPRSSTATDNDPLSSRMNSPFFRAPALPPPVLRSVLVRARARARALSHSASARLLSSPSSSSLFFTSLPIFPPASRLRAVFHARRLAASPARTSHRNASPRRGGGIQREGGGWGGISARRVSNAYRARGVFIFARISARRINGSKHAPSSMWRTCN
jgi:hypothetical protein